MKRDILILMLILILLPLVGCEEDPEATYGHQTRPFVLMEQHVGDRENPVLMCLYGVILAVYLSSIVKEKFLQK